MIRWLRQQWRHLRRWNDPIRQWRRRRRAVRTLQRLNDRLMIRYVVTGKTPAGLQEELDTTLRRIRRQLGVTVPE